jgi:chemotaxis protein CheX
MNNASQTATSPPLPLPDWQPLLELAVREVFETMLGCKLESCGESPSPPEELTAMVGLAGQLCGLVTLRCTAKAAASMASRLLGVEIQEADKQMVDAVGEVTNMIAGNFKDKLIGIGEKCMLSVPTVILGSNYSCRAMANSAPLEVTALFEGAQLTIALEIHS